MSTTSPSTSINRSIGTTVKTKVKVLPMAEPTRYFRNQKYQKLKQKCQKEKKLFEDPEFAASLSILSASSRSIGRVEWKRPTELCPDPTLLVDSLKNSKIAQGSLGNCWFVAACCSLAKEKELWNKVVPNHESQDYKNDSHHCGIISFRVWRFGQWVEVTIDDRLPTVNGKLIFAHSLKKNEFWCSLLEKAYAKLCGSYAALEGGNLVDALVDMTAGFAETVNLVEDGTKRSEEKQKILFKHLKEEFKNHSLMCCAIKATAQDREARTPMGLVKGHAYCISNVLTVNIKSTGLFAIFKGKEKLKMIRLRNPWAEVEWKGAFSDCSLEWSKVSAQDRKKCGLTFEEDGEFWMTFEDFCKHFTDLSLCYLVNTSWFTLAQAWNEAIQYGRWCNGPPLSPTDRSGGCANNKTTFLRNPQYCLDVKNDEDKLLIMLQQKDLDRARSLSSTLLSIGVQILRVELNRVYRLHLIRPEASSSSFCSTRNMFHKCTLSEGRYVIMPTTYQPRQYGDFLLRVFSKSAVHLREMKEDVPKPTRNLFKKTSPRLATYIKIREAKDLRISTSSETCSPYYIVTCEGKSMRGPLVKNDNNPKWKDSLVFYRKNPKANLKVQIWASKAVKHALISEIEVETPVKPSLAAMQVALTAPKGSELHGSVGYIVYEWLSTTNLAQI